MLQNFIQEQVDQVAEKLQRSIAVDDVSINLVAASRHFGDADDARVRAMLARTLDKQSIEYLYSFGILEKHEDCIPVGANENLGIKNRYCFPIRSGKELLGFLWLLGDISEKEEKLAKKSAAELAVPMLGIKLMKEKTLQDQEGLVKDLIFENSHRVSRSVYLLSRQGRMNIDEKHMLICIASSSEKQQLAIKDFRVISHRLSNYSLGDTGKTDSPLYPLFTTLRTEFLIVLPAKYFCQEFIDIILSLSLSCPIKIGLGPKLNTFQLYESYLQASAIAQILKVIPHAKEVASWEDLGVYGHLVLYLLDRRKGMACLPMTPKIIKLNEYGDVLIETLENYLDNAGNVAESSAQLNIHRSTLYYRLSRIEEVTETDLSSGSDRLLLHLEVKLWQLANQYPLKQMG